MRELSPKQQQMQNLVSEMKYDSSMEEIWVTRQGEKKNVGLINQFKYHEPIPNKWFDWVRTADAPIMIIGQDWGPYAVLKEFIADIDTSKTEDDEYYRQYLFSKFSSRTEKFIQKAVETTYKQAFNTEFTLDKWDSIAFTMAVLFTRQGKHFRGSEFFDQNKSAELSYKYVSQQIDIIQPKLIMPLGNLAFETLNHYFQLGYKQPKITKIVQDLNPDGVIQISDTIILPNFHPAAHVDPKIQMNIWEKMWDYVKI